MKKSSLKILISIFFFLVYHADNAQSFTTASENVTIKIVKKISVSINNSVENNYNHRYRHINKAYSRNLLISYKKSFNDFPYSSSLLKISSFSKNALVPCGKEKEIRCFNKRGNLNINIKNQTTNEDIVQKHFVTIVY